MIALTRIDDRLLHGQVAFGWAPALKVNVILIVNDEAKENKMKAMALNLAKPNDVKLYIRGVAESGEIVKKFSEAQKSKVLILVRNTDDALQLAKESDGAIKEINVGGLRYEEGKKKLTDLIAASDGDINNFKEMDQMGIDLEFRILPRDRKQTLENLIQ
ncbi:PTS system mannose/fructose/N-acetylgalactosamine-transporter subunit IIB [Sporolactobacillus terrae]|uniref:PTS mannose transporter subunit IIA n=1 Tax=Sporolactobacillus terrae TaxID=269673 RepID=A0A5K7X1H2_9BACL|nr:PTS sugar transporter subunit IIB [Sporolactobacillus terrae]BBN99834.1 PTS mannose transporter subunit IIA [Sporolactobacillus terrae]